MRAIGKMSVNILADGYASKVFILGMLLFCEETVGGYTCKMKWDGWKCRQG
jgi:hypothetical protein